LSNVYSIGCLTQKTWFPYVWPIIRDNLGPFDVTLRKRAFLEVKAIELLVA
jgi:hypothetical protein